MEKKIKYRILGFLVLIIFIIIFLGFFQHPANQTNVTLVQPPSFPNPINQLDNKDESDINISKPESPITSSTIPINIAATTSPINTEEPKNQNQIESFVYENKHPIITGNSLAQDQNNIKSLSFHKKNNNQIITNSIKSNRLIGSSNFAWAIQLGSFKNKKNAIHFINYLREHGYRAFLHQANTSLGETTRVYIGPELQQALIHQLALKLKNDLHIKGIIIRYQPLNF